MSENGVSSSNGGFENSGYDRLWYCLQAQPKMERLAEITLQREVGAEVFYPKLQYQKVARRKGIVWVNESLFPGYLFARFSLDKLPMVRYAHGVSKVLKLSGQYCEVPEDVIGKIRGHLNEKGICVLSNYLKPGDEVTVGEGAMKGLNAVVTQYMPAKKRVKILIEFLGQKNEVEIDPVSVVKNEQRIIME